MPKKDSFECDNCGKRSFEFTPDWFHVKHLLFSKGKYSEFRDYENYLSFGNLTFCSNHCLISFVQKAVQDKTKKDINPSSRAFEDNESR